MKSFCRRKMYKMVPVVVGSALTMVGCTLVGEVRGQIAADDGTE